ncbi:MAG: sulfotransferase [Bauldia sp.]|nr:sulfotransferase [Bauldia sp.]
MTGPHAPQRCLGTVLIDARPEDRFLLKIDAPDGSLAAFAQKPGVRDALITAVKLRRRKRGGYRLKIPPGRHRLLLFADHRGGSADFCLVVKSDGRSASFRLRRGKFARSRLFGSPARRISRDEDTGRLTITTTLAQPTQFRLVAFPLAGPLVDHPWSKALDARFHDCRLGPGQNDIPNPFAGSDDLILAVVPWSDGYEATLAAKVVGLEVCPASPPAAVRRAGQRRIHVVGTGPRTGTTLMAEALCACFRVDQHSEHEDSVFTELPGDGPLTVTKNPGDITVARTLLRYDPDLYFVCMLRDPRDTIVSVHAGRRGSYYTGLRFWKQSFPYWRRIKDHPRLVTVRYEDLVSDPDAVQAYLEERLPFLERLAPFSRFHEVAAPSKLSLNALNGLRPIASASVGSHRMHLGRVRAQVDLHGSIAADLIAAGYETDADWEARLREVPRDDRPSALGEFYSADATRKLWRKRRTLIRAFIARHRKADQAPPT